MDLGLKGRRALVFGASRGLGRGIAEALAQEGCDLILAARNQATLAEAAREIRDRCGVVADPLVLDLGAPGTAASAAAFASARGGADILVNISGGPPASKLIGIPDELMAPPVRSHGVECHFVSPTPSCRK